MTSPILPFLRTAFKTDAFKNAPQALPSQRYIIPLLVRPNVPRPFEGIYQLTTSYVEVHVSNRAVNYGANIGVLEVLSKALGLPKTHIEIVKGENRRRKVVQVGILTRGSDEEKMRFIGEGLSRRARVKGLQEKEVGWVDEGEDGVEGKRAGGQRTKEERLRVKTGRK